VLEDPGDYQHGSPGRSALQHNRSVPEGSTVSLALSQSNWDEQWRGWGTEEDACLEKQDGRSLWKEMGSRAGDIHSPKGHVDNRRSKGGVMQRLTGLLVNSVPIKALHTFG